MDQRTGATEMAKQAEDTKTIELIPEATKRGRPATGKAMSAAERKRAERERWEDLRTEGTLNDVPITALLDWTARAIRTGWPELVRYYAIEMEDRARANDNP
jgi:hypothetical protein